MKELTKNKRWLRLTELCWEGFDKVMDYANKEYPGPSRNKSLERLMSEYNGNWGILIDKISK
jgi:hypothetical protein